MKNAQRMINSELSFPIIMEGRNRFLLWLILLAAIISISSAGAVFQLMNEVDPLLRSSWRFQLTALFMFPFFIYQTKQSVDNSEFVQQLKEKDTIYIIIGSGLSLGLHMGAWVWSLDNTSLTHSLLFVTIHPLIIVTGALFLRYFVPKKQIMGAIVGFVGGSIALLGISSDNNATIIGDLAAVFGAFAVVGYFLAGRKLRQWMPLFTYIFPVTLIAAIQLALISIFLEDSTLSLVNSNNSIFGWFSITWLPYVLYLALFPGIVGHAGISMVLRWFPPIVVSVAYLFEPLIGSIIGWLLGTTDIPSTWTWIGGTILIIGMGIIVTNASEEGEILEE